MKVFRYLYRIIARFAALNFSIRKFSLRRNDTVVGTLWTQIKHCTVDDKCSACPEAIASATIQDEALEQTEGEPVSRSSLRTDSIESIEDLGSFCIPPTGTFWKKHILCFIQFFNRLLQNVSYELCFLQWEWLITQILFSGKQGITLFQLNQC